MNEQKDWTFKIGGMTCDHCAASINEALRRVRGVVEISASYAEGEARVIAETSVDGASLASAIRNAGYRVLAQESRVVGFERGRADEQFDLAVIGGGSAAFAAAIKAAELGVRVALVEGGTLGGTCVNVGCLPSKTLIRAAEVLHRAGHHAFAAIHTEAKAADFAAVVRQKDELVAELRRAKYWDVLAAYPSVKLIEGRARFRDDGTLEVDAGLWWPTESS